MIRLKNEKEIEGIAICWDLISVLWISLFEGSLYPAGMQSSWAGSCVLR